jgi:hypothetical protein
MTCLPTRPVAPATKTVSGATRVSASLEGGQSEENGVFAAGSANGAGRGRHGASKGRSGLHFLMNTGDERSGEATRMGNDLPMAVYVHLPSLT